MICFKEEANFSRFHFLENLDFDERGLHKPTKTTNIGRNRWIRLVSSNKNTPNWKN